MVPPMERLPDVIDSCEYIDAHVHCDAYAERETLIQSLNTHRILNLSSGMDIPSWRQNEKLSEDSPWIIPCTGVHPWQAGQYDPDEILRQKDSYASSPMISEIGLDTVWAGKDAPLERQIPLLEVQLRLAQEYRKPVTLHTKGAEQQILAILGRYSLPGVLIHWYDGPRDLLQDYLDLGCSFTIPLPILKNQEYRDFILKIPADRLLPETDNPSSWPWLFHQPGKPDQIKQIYEEYSRIVGKNQKMIHNQFKENLKCLLRRDS